MGGSQAVLERGGRGPALRAHPARGGVGVLFGAVAGWVRLVAQLRPSVLDK